MNIQASLMGHLPRNHDANLMKPPPPSPPSHSSDASFPILAISVAGILATAILLLSYYVFVIKCCVNRQPSFARRRRRRRWLSPDAILAEASRYWTTVTERGLDEATIRAIPTLRFRREENCNSLQECAVCLDEFQEGERLRMLPNCRHVFHIDCVDTWLQTHDNCPLCRSGITGTGTAPVMQTVNPEQGQSVVVDVRDDGTEQAATIEASSNGVNPTTTGAGKETRKKMQKVLSYGDEFIDLRGKDDEFDVQPMRRSFSMGSTSGRQKLYMTVQGILMQNPHFRVDVDEGTSSAGCGRTRRSFFSFGGHCRTASSAALPVHN